MIGSYLDKQVTNIKNGVLAAGSLIGIGMIIYFVVKKRKSIASTLGIGKKEAAEEVVIDKPKLIENKAPKLDEPEDATVEINTDDDFDEEDENNNKEEGN